MKIFEWFAKLLRLIAKLLRLIPLKWRTRIALALSSLLASSPIAFAQTSSTQEITDVVLAWMPLIIIFAMLGMVLGMLRKFGKI